MDRFDAARPEDELEEPEVFFEKLPDVGKIRRRLGPFGEPCESAGPG